MPYFSSCQSIEELIDEVIVPVVKSAIEDVKCNFAEENFDDSFM